MQARLDRGRQYNTDASKSHTKTVFTVSRMRREQQSLTATLVSIAPRLLPPLQPVRARLGAFQQQGGPRRATCPAANSGTCCWASWPPLPSGVVLVAIMAHSPHPFPSLSLLFSSSSSSLSLFPPFASFFHLPLAVKVAADKLRLAMTAAVVAGAEFHRVFGQLNGVVASSANHLEYHRGRLTDMIDMMKEQNRQLHTFTTCLNEQVHIPPHPPRSPSLPLPLFHHPKAIARTCCSDATSAVCLRLSPGLALLTSALPHGHPRFFTVR